MVATRERVVAATALLLLAAWPQVAAAQYGGGNSLGGAGMNGSSLSGGLGSSPFGSSSLGGSNPGQGSSSFRPNNSTFGSPLNIATGAAQATDPFAAARGGLSLGGFGTSLIPGQDPSAAMGAAGLVAGRGSSTRTNNRPTTNQNMRGMNQQNMGMTGPSLPQVVRIEIPAAPIGTIGIARTAVAPPRLPTTFANADRVRVDFDGQGAVVLRGRADSKTQARMAAALLSLEPGVRTIRNELEYPR
ncbi:MAG: BON domain-containing protein [Planctomycetia bacterium]